MNKENKKHYLIYQTTNLVNNKIYIGKHITENIEDQYFGSGKYLRNAIKKYGLENFEFKILFELQNEEEMNLLEKCVVTQEFCDREDTYNINVGGDGGWSYVNSEKSPYNYKSIARKNTGKKGGIACQLKLKTHGLSSIKIFFNNSTKDEQIEYRNKLSNCIKIFNKHNPGFFAGKNNPMYGRFHTENAKIKMSKAQTGLKNSQFGTIWICNDLTKENKKILKTDSIPNGWRKGRICKK